MSYLFQYFYRKLTIFWAFLRDGAKWRNRTSPTYILEGRQKSEYCEIFNFFDKEYYSKTEQIHFSNLLVNPAELNKEAMLLEGYLNMYEGTSKEEYIQKFKKRTNNIFETAMPNGIFLGWKEIHKQHWNLVNNPYFIVRSDFDFGPDPTVSNTPVWSADYVPIWPEKWNYSEGVNLVASELEKETIQTYREESDFSIILLKKPFAIITIDAPVGDQPNIVEFPLCNPFVLDNPNFEPNQEYGLEFWGNAENGATGFVEIYDKKENTILSQEPLKNGENLRKHNDNNKWIAPGGNLDESEPRLWIRILHMGSTNSSKIAVAKIVIQQFGRNILYESRIIYPLAKFCYMYHKGMFPKTLSLKSFANITKKRIDTVMKHWDPYCVEFDGKRALYIHPDDGTSRFPHCSQAYNAYLKIGSVHAYLSSFELDRFNLARKLFRVFTDNLKIDRLNADKPEYFKWRYWDIYQNQTASRKRENNKREIIRIRDKARPAKTGGMTCDKLIYKNYVENWTELGYAGRDASSALIGYKQYANNLTRTDMQRLASSFTERATYFRNEMLPREVILYFFEKTEPFFVDNIDCSQLEAEADRNKCANRDRLVWWIDWIAFHEFEPRIFEWAKQRFDANIKKSPSKDVQSENGKHPQYEDKKTGGFDDSVISAMRLASEFVKLAK